MCDTFVFIPPSKEEPVILGKNSDREPDEAQSIVHYPQSDTAPETQQTTNISVHAPTWRNEVYLSKPFQMWGAEMGVNQHGVAIGNEAVFTKIPFNKKNTGLTGMDMLRLALEIATDATVALETIIEYLIKYGQNACGGYNDKRFYYHNSFLIADAHRAYVLETAGNFWVYQQVTGFRAISNGLSIEAQYDGIHPEAIDFAYQKAWSKKNEDLILKNHFPSF